MSGIYFLFGLSVIWTIFATVQDFRFREISNWLNFSLIIFALGYKFIYSLFVLNNFSFFIQGVIGLGVFFVLGNLLYYSKMFAGGDYRLFVSLGAVLPFFGNTINTLELLFFFVLIFLFAGAVYGIFYSIVVGIINFEKVKKRFIVEFHKKMNLILVGTFLGIVFLVLSFKIKPFFYLGIFMVFIIYYYLFVKSIDESYMVKKIKTTRLTLGDWLYKDVKVGKKVVRATWDGLGEEDIALLKKKKYVLIRDGLQFAPVFLMSLLVFYLILLFFPNFLMTLLSLFI